MHRTAQRHNSTFGVDWNSVLALMIVLLVLIAVVLFIVFTAQPAHGQTFQVIYNFTGGQDGAFPEPSNVVFDASGNMYGTTNLGGAYGYGTVWEVTP